MTFFVTRDVLQVCGGFGAVNALALFFLGRVYA